MRWWLVNEAFSAVFVDRRIPLQHLAAAPHQTSNSEGQNLFRTVAENASRAVKEALEAADKPSCYN